MTEPAPVDLGPWPGFERTTIPGRAGELSARVAGDADAPAVVFSHSILTSSAIWRRQAELTLGRGYRVICLDTRGHGASQAGHAPYAMDDLADDVVTTLDALGIPRAHHVGVSLGGMTGLGLGVRYRERLLSLCVVAARADAPEPFARVWDERIALVRVQGSVDGLAQATAERWFGRPFLHSHPEVEAELLRCIRQTSPEGFVGCAQAIQGLDYLAEVPAIDKPTTLVIGAADSLLLEPMRALAKVIGHADLIELPGAGHLPQVDSPQAFDLALLGHLAKASAV